MIGDPKAITRFEAKLSGLSVALTPSCHYLPTLSTLTSHSHHYHSFPHLLSSPKLSGSWEREHRDLPFTPSSSSSASSMSVPPPPLLPCLYLTCASADADMLLPMYRHNALPSLPQKQQVRVGTRDIGLGTFKVWELGQCLDKLRRLWREGEGEEGRFFELPSADFTYNSVVHGDGDRDGADKGTSDDTSHANVGLAEASLTLSHRHIAKLLFVYKSWTSSDSSSSDSTPSPPSSVQQLTYTPPQALPGPASHCHLTLSDLSLSKTSNSQFVSRCLVLGAVRGSIMRGGGGGGGEAGSPLFLPFLYGPFDTRKWNGAEQCEGISLASKNKRTRFSEKLVKLVVATPHEKIKGKLFHTIN